MSNKKTLAMIMEDFHENLPACPHCNSSEKVVKSGSRSLKEDAVQLFLCKSCNKRFSDRKLPKTSYPPKLILYALTYYNQGHTLDMTIRTMRRRYKTIIPMSTLRNWIKRYGDDLPFTKLRKRYDLDPNSTIRTRRLFHPQPYLFKVHTLKLNIAGKIHPRLKRYINGMLEDTKDYMFQSKNVLRVSELANEIELPKQKVRPIKDSPACRMTSLALELAKTKKQRHEKVEEFFLTNDTATMAVELPVYLDEKESGYDRPLVGHIDMVQIRQNRIHILDYKPDEEGSAEAQLMLYAMCIKKRTGLKDITCAYFDENKHYQFTPSM